MMQQLGLLPPRRMNNEPTGRNFKVLVGRPRDESNTISVIPKRGLLAWLDRLMMRSRHFDRAHISVAAIRELEPGICLRIRPRSDLRDVITTRLIDAADLSYQSFFSRWQRYGWYAPCSKSSLVRPTYHRSCQVRVDPEPDYGWCFARQTSLPGSNFSALGNQTCHPAVTNGL